MNKARKQNIKSIRDTLNSVLSGLENILDEEQDYYDNMPENLQCSTRADTSQDAIDDLTEAIESLNEVINHLNNI